MVPGADDETTDGQVDVPLNAPMIRHDGELPGLFGPWWVGW